MRLVDAAPQPVAERHEQGADHEGHAPAPAVQLRRAQRRVQHRAGQRAGQRRQPLAGELERGIEAAPVRWRLLDQQRGGGAHLAARGEALQQAREHQDHRRSQARLRVGGRRRDHRGTQRHQQQGQDHRAAAARPIGVDADHDAAQRARHETHAEAGHRQHQLAEGRADREEQPADQQREIAVDGEIVELERIADGGRRDQAAGLAARGAGGGQGDFDGGRFHRHLGAETEAGEGTEKQRSSSGEAAEQSRKANGSRRSACHPAAKREQAAPRALLAQSTSQPSATRTQ